MLAWTENQPITSEDTATIYYLVSWYLGSIGRYNEAEDKAKISANILTSILGADHPDSLTSMANLASTYSNQGRWTEAEELQVTVMETMKRALGAEHPSTLTSMSNLAHTLHSLGRTRDAIAMMTDALVHRTARLGVSHPDTKASQLTLEDWNKVIYIPLRISCLDR